MKPYRIIITLLIVVTILFLLTQRQLPVKAGNDTSTAFVFLPAVLRPEADDLAALSDQYEDALIDNQAVCPCPLWRLP